MTLTCFKPLVVLPLSVLYLYSRITWNIDSRVLINWTCPKYSSYKVQHYFSCRTGAVYLCKELLVFPQCFQFFPWDISSNVSKSRNSQKKLQTVFSEIVWTALYTNLKDTGYDKMTLKDNVSSILLSITSLKSTLGLDNDQQFLTAN